MTNDSLLEHMLDEYRIELLLGQGGMARVYRGLDTRLRRYAAIKVIDTPLRQDTEYARRFEREAQAIAQLEHPHIVRLYRYGEAQGVLYMAMQYVDGADLGFVLHSYRKDGEFIESNDASRIIRQVCSALDYVHSQGIIHRDIKPSNIMLDKQGQVHLTDFGLALLTELGTRGEIFGTPHYIAPEQAISSAGAVPQSDLYAVGIILYEMFTGQLPYDSEIPMDTAMLHLEGNAIPPREHRRAISPDVEAVILKAMARQPIDRYPNGAALAQALEQALQGVNSRPQAATLSRRSLSVPERVAVELNANPLPPIPAEIVQPVAETIVRPASAPPPALPTYLAKSRRPSVLAGLGVGAVVIIAAAILLFAILSDGDDSGSSALSENVIPSVEAVADHQNPTSTVTPTTIPPTATSTPTNTATLTMIPPTATLLPTNTITLTQTATLVPTATRIRLPTRTPIPSSPTPKAVIATQTEYIIEFSKQGKDRLAIENQSDQAFPLSRLELRIKNSTIQGSEWDVEWLAPSGCVVIAKNPDKSDASELACTQVGTPLKQKDKKWWKPDFDVFYDGEKIKECKDNPCQIRIPS